MQKGGLGAEAGHEFCTIEPSDLTRVTNPLSFQFLHLQSNLDNRYSDLGILFLDLGIKGFLEQPVRVKSHVVCQYIK